MNQEAAVLLAALPLGALVYHWLKYDKRARVAEIQARDAEIKAGKEAGLAAMVDEQVALEDAELALKRKNPVLPIDAFLGNPSAFASVVKYKLEFVDMKGVYYKKEDLLNFSFCTTNLFEAAGEVVNGTFGDNLGTGITCFRRHPKTGFDMNQMCPGFQIELAVGASNARRHVYVNIPYQFSPEVAAKTDSGYKTAVALSPWDVFKGRMVKGARVRVRGDVFTRLTSKWNSDEEHLRKNQPAGVYLVCKPEDVVFE